MKKKLLLLTVLVMVFVCLFVISSSAATTPDPTRGTVTLEDNTVCALYDTEGNALIWYASTVNPDDGFANYDFVRADSGNGEEGYDGGTVYYKATYSFSADINTSFDRTKDSFTLYEVSQIRIVDVKNNEFGSGKIVVFNMKDDDVKVNEASNETYIDKPVNCIKTVFWANKIIEYIYFREDLGALQANAINGCDKLKYINFEELVNLRQIAGTGIANNPNLFLKGTLDLSKTELVTVSGSGAAANNRYSVLILPETFKNFGDYPFEKNPNLTKVVFNSTSLVFSGTNHFYNCTSLTTIEGFGNLTAISIPKGFCQNTALTSIELPQTIETIGDYAFDSSALTSITIPNSCTSIGQNAFQGCKSLKVVRLGASCNTLVNYDSFKNCSALEAVYIPATLEVIPGNEFNVSADNCVFYYTGSKEQLDLLKSNTNSNNTAFLEAYANPISAKTITDFDTITGKCIVYDYNICDAFYGSVCGFENDDNDCTTAVNCNRTGCERVALKASGGHVIGHSVEYANGFLMAGVHTQYCTNAGCEAANKTEDLRPMFVADGYSYKTAGTTAGISVKYTINTYEYKLYQAHVSKLSFGVIVANAEKIGADTFITDEGTLNALENKGIQVNLKSDDYSTLTCTVNGFTNEEKYLALKLVMSAYVYEVDENGNKTSDVTYIQKVYTQKENETDPAYTAYADTIEREATLGVVTIGQVKAHDEYLLKQ